MGTMASVAGSERGAKQALAPRSHVHAELRLEFERDDAEGQTVLAASHQEPPLRVVRAFPLADGAALVHLHNVSGGLLGGEVHRRGRSLGGRPGRTCPMYRPGASGAIRR